MRVDQPNERADKSSELRGDEETTPTSDGSGGLDREKRRASIRWVQLAYDLEQYGDANPEERGEVY